MAKRTKRRPLRGPHGQKPVRRIPFTLPDGRRGEAHDLNDVVRDVITEIRQANEWSEAETAANLGMTQQALNDFMNVDRNVPHVEGEKPKGTLTVHTLSKIAATSALNSPVVLFQRHPLFAGQANAAAYEALCGVLSSTEAEQLAQIVDVLRGRESLAEFLERTNAMLGIDQKRPRNPK
jgi:transcriptional regulator with XRE-family HTH domain